MKVLSIEFTADYIYIYKQNLGKNEVVVEEKFRLNMPQNAYYNKMLINNDRSISDTIKNCISEHNIKYKKVIVAIPNTDSMVEEFSVLEGNKKHIDGMVEQELRKRHKLNTNYLYDYIIIGKDPLKPGFVKIQVTLCVKAMLQNIYDVVKKAGLIPYKVVFTNHIMEEIASRCNLVSAKESSIISCINSDEAHFLYVGHGEDPYYRYSRIKTESKVEENLYILSSLNNINEENNDDDDDLMLGKLQGDLTRLSRFHSQRHPDEEIGKIYLYGSYNKLDKLKSRISETLNLETEILRLQGAVEGVKYSFSEDEYTCNAVASAMTFLDKQTGQYDFFSKLDDTGDSDKNKMLLPIFITIPIVLLVLIGTMLNKSKISDLRAEIAEADEFLKDKSINIQYEEKDRLIDLCGKYATYNKQVSDAIDLLENMPRYDSSVFSNIDKMKPDSIIITGYSYSNGSVTLGCYSMDQYTPAEFAKSLKESNLYKEVIYTGFTRKAGTTGEEIYTFNISIKLW